jgi:hypothetical protein
MRNEVVRSSVIDRILSLGILVVVVLAAGVALAQTQPQPASVRPSYAMPSWEQTLHGPTRFVVLSNFGGAAVLDRNTGLVWEKSPHTVAVTWNGARFHCINKNVGGQKGWRLPSIPELASLLDPSVAAPGPTLPSGHPFTGIQPAGYWSATTSAEDPSEAWFVYFRMGFVDSDSKSFSGQVWCVRGAMNAEKY